MKKVKIVFSSGKVSDLILSEVDICSADEIMGKSIDQNRTVIVNRNAVAYIEVIQK